MVLKKPKTHASIRTLSLPDLVLDALRVHRRHQLEQRMAMGLGKPDAHALVFPTLDGGLARRTGLSLRWSETAAALGIPQITYHALRHSHASMLIAAKVDLPTIAKRMGHASPAVTLRTYAPLFHSDVSAAADAINATLAPNLFPTKWNITLILLG